MEFAPLAEALIKYGPVALIAWFAWRDYKREERMATALDAQAKAYRIIAVKAVRAISKSNLLLTRIWERISPDKPWDGKERRKDSQRKEGNHE